MQSCWPCNCSYDCLKHSLVEMWTGESDQKTWCFLKTSRPSNRDQKMFSWMTCKRVLLKAKRMKNMSLRVDCLGACEVDRVWVQVWYWDVTVFEKRDEPVGYDLGRKRQNKGNQFREVVIWVGSVLSSQRRGASSVWFLKAARKRYATHPRPNLLSHLLYVLPSGKVVCQCHNLNLSDTIYFRENHWTTPNFPWNNQNTLEVYVSCFARYKFVLGQRGGYSGKLRTLGVFW